jgi:hypothetical protein
VASAGAQAYVSVARELLERYRRSGDFTPPALVAQPEPLTPQEQSD